MLGSRSLLCLFCHGGSDYSPHENLNFCMLGLFQEHLCWCDWCFSSTISASIEKPVSLHFQTDFVKRHIYNYIYIYLFTLSNWCKLVIVIIMNQDCPQLIFWDKHWICSKIHWKITLQTFNDFMFNNLKIHEYNFRSSLHTVCLTYKKTKAFWSK